GTNMPRAAAVTLTDRPNRQITSTKHIDTLLLSVSPLPVLSIPPPPLPQAPNRTPRTNPPREFPIASSAARVNPSPAGLLPLVGLQPRFVRLGFLTAGRAAGTKP
uniref:Uncharacterized protein n=1 Tax=Aegilops tauschii subsp. strangulata TaxID=200361 RepID=A0A453RQ29_AEGTS